MLTSLVAGMGDWNPQAGDGRSELNRMTEKFVSCSVPCACLHLVTAYNCLAANRRSGGGRSGTTFSIPTRW